MKRKQITYECIPPVGISEKRRNSLDRDTIVRDLANPCLCKDFVCIDKITIHDIITVRTHYHSKNEIEKMNWLLSLLQHFFDNVNNTIIFRVLGKPVCRVGFLNYHGITQYKYYTAIKKLRLGQTYVVHGNTEADCSRILSDKCFDFLLNYQTKFAEIQPDCDEFHLPRFILRVDLYSAFVETLTLSDMIPSYTTFARVWKEDFPNLKIPKNTRLGKCDICASLSNQSRSLTAESRVIWSTKKREHIRFIRDERNENTKRINNSKNYPNLVTLLGIDRMNAIRMPWQVPFPKSWLTKNRLRYEVIGYMNFSNSNNIFFHGLSLFPHDSDTTLTILYWKIRTLHIDGLCGSKLQLHMDNCYRENKNKYVLAFSCMLVHLKWFDEVTIFFLPPGHTHAENDALFVPLSNGKWTINCHSPPQFGTQFIPHCYRNYRNATAPDLQVIKYVFGFKDLFTPHIRNITHHGTPRVFRFTLVNGVVEMFYKNTCLETTWIGYHENSGFQLMTSYPDSPPIPIRPKILTDEELADIPFTYPLLDPNSKIWWEKFILDQTIIQPSEDELTECIHDFWTVTSDEIVLQIEEQPIRTIPVTPIHVANHPVVVSEIEIGSFVALLPISSDPTLFWLAKVIDIEDDLFHVHYFECTNNKWTKMSKKSRGYLGTTTISSIMAANFTLTKSGAMRKNIVKKILVAINNLS